jgi:hypothetical protein
MRAVKCPDCGAEDAVRLADLRMPTGPSAGPAAQGPAPPQLSKRRSKLTAWSIVIGITLLGAPLGAFTQQFLPAQDVPWLFVCSLASLPVLAIAWVSGRLDRRARKAEYATALERWDRLWRCSQCGHVGDAAQFDAP